MYRRIGIPTHLRLGPALLAAWIGLAAHPAGGAETPEDPASKNWRLGPVKYLLTREEDKKFKSLRTPPQREEFVAAFWERRDPTPGTEANEFRDDFWVLVEQANQLFPSNRGGWATDRGMVHILLGPPASREPDPNPDGSLKQVRWIYTPDTALGADFIAIFRPEEDGTLILANTRDVDRIVEEKPDLIGLGEKLAAPPPPKAAAAPGPAAGEPAPAAPATVSPAAVRLLDRFSSGGSERHEIRFQARWNFFEATGNTTHTVLTIGVIPPPAIEGDNRAEAEDLEVFARLVPAAGGAPIDLTGVQRFGRADEIEEAPSGPFRLYQARVSLAPGTYRLYAGVRNRIDGRAGTREETVEVPDFSSSDLSISSITLASSIRPSGVPESDLSPFTFGKYRVIPRIEPVYRSSDEFSFYYQVYNAEHDPATEKPRLDIEYQFLMKKGSTFRLAASVPKKGQDTAALGFSLPLQGWPATDYRLRVKVTDRLSGNSTAREIDFRLQ